MKNQLVPCISLLFASAFSQAAEINVEITNLTQGITFTPFLVAAHGDAHLFQVGAPASDEIQAMAEGGTIDGLVAQVEGLNGVVSANPAEGLLMPGESTVTGTIDTGDNNFLTVVAMLLPTNDAFAGLDAWEIPSEPGTYTLNLNAYDAGTEANNELLTPDSGAPGVLGMPAAPGGDAGTGGTGVTTTETNEVVHIHRGSLGDTDPAGGVSDLDATIHRWLNPVVRLVVTVE